MTDPRIEQTRQELRVKHVDDLVADLRRLAGPGQMGCQRAGALLAAADRLEHALAWKLEACAVLDQWEQAWDAAGRPGALGESKAKALLRWVQERS